MSNFHMGTILGKGFAQALVHNINSTSADIAFSSSRNLILIRFFKKTVKLLTILEKSFPQNHFSMVDIGKGHVTYLLLKKALPKTISP